MQFTHLRAPALACMIVLSGAAPGRGTTQSAAATVNLRQEHGTLYLQAAVNGIGPLLMIFDPGGSDVYTSFAQSHLKGEQPRTLCLSTACVPVAMDYVDGDPNQLDPKHDGKDGTIAGSVGPAVLRHYVVRLDYRRSSFTLVPVTAFVPPRGTTRLPLAFDSYGLPTMRATVDGFSGIFELDVRAGTSMLFAPFLEHTKLAGTYAMSPIVKRSSALVAHAVRKLSIAAWDLRDVPFWFSTATEGKFANPAVAGLLGNNVFANFVLTLDFAHRAAYISRQ